VRSPYSGKEWWRKVRLPQIEKLASEQIVRYESKICKIDTPWIPVDKFIENLWKYNLLYDDPESYGAATGALAALLPDLQLVVVSDRAEDRSRLEWNAAHEGAHIVVHVPPAGEPSQGSLSFGSQIDVSAVKRSIYCRGNACGFLGGPEEPYMYREAEFFAGCLLMPRDRYGPLAKMRLTEALDECMHRGRIGLQEIESSNGLRAATYTQAVELAVGKMAACDLNGTVSKQAQRIRLSNGEIGLIRELDGLQDASRGWVRKGYEFSEHMVALASRELGLDYSPEWRGIELTLK
jgi:hypothetical protein